MFEEFLQKIDNFNELTGCEGKYTLIEKDGEINFVTPTKEWSVPTYKDKETYFISLKKPDEEWGKNSRICKEFVISAGYDKAIVDMAIKGATEFMNSVEGRTLFNT